MGRQPYEGQAKRIVTWEEITKNAEILANKVPHGNKMTFLFSIPKNGFIIAGFLAFYRKDFMLHLPKISSGLQPDSSRVLIVDDIHDTGETLNKMLRNTVTGNVESAMLYWRKKEDDNKPTYWAETVEDDAWLVFPWEKE